VARAGAEDAAILLDAGLSVDWRRREPTFYHAIIADAAESTKLVPVLSDPP
jgi:hypothetical protein